jgi:hypothetical protein
MLRPENISRFLRTVSSGNFILEGIWELMSRKVITLRACRTSANYHSRISISKAPTSHIRFHHKLAVRADIISIPGNHISLQRRKFQSSAAEPATNPTPDCVWTGICPRKQAGEPRRIVTGKGRGRYSRHDDFVDVSINVNLSKCGKTPERCMYMCASAFFATRLFLVLVI